jgi:hypothetical protein
MLNAWSPTGSATLGGGRNFRKSDLAGEGGHGGHAFEVISGIWSLPCYFASSLLR